jgi:hypothetical protein
VKLVQKVKIQVVHQVQVGVTPMEVVPMAVTKSCSFVLLFFCALCFVLSLRREREREWNEEEEVRTILAQH